MIQKLKQKLPIIFIALIASVWAIFIADTDTLFYPEYRALKKYSKEQTESFEIRLSSAMQEKSVFYLRDLVDFEWDTVCAMGGYSRLRQDLALEQVLGKDIPILEHFPQVNEYEYNFVFLKNDKSIAVIEHFQPRLKYTFGLCSSHEDAHFKLIDPQASVPNEVQKSQSYQVYWENIKPYAGCVGNNCQLTFHGK